MVKKENPYDEKYSAETYYWGKQPSAMCDRVIEIFQPSAEKRLKLLDLGCGEGRNAVYFAKYDFKVFALDKSLQGLRKTEMYAKEVGVQVETIQADIMKYKLEDTYDVIFSTGTLQYLPPDVRNKRYQNYKDCTSSNGINGLSVFVEKPFIARAPDAEDTAYLYKSGELFSYYWDWEIVYCTEEIFDCMSSGIPHEHAVDRIIAKKRDI